MTQFKSARVYCILAAILLVTTLRVRAQSTTAEQPKSTQNAAAAVPASAGENAAQPAGSPPTAPSAAATDDAPNLLRNASAETGESMPDHWQQSKQVDGVEFIWDRKSGRDGKSSLGLHKTVQRYFPIAQWFQEVEWKGGGPVLHVSAQVKAENLSKAILDILFLDETGTWIEHRWVSYIGEKDDGPPITHDWKEYQGDIRVPPGTKLFRIGLQMYGPGQVWFDDIQASVAGETKTNPQPVPVPEENANVPRHPKTKVSQIQIPVRRQDVDAIMSAIKSEYVDASAEDLTIDARLFGETGAAVMVSGSPENLTMISEFVRGMPRQHQTELTGGRQPDATDARLELETRKLATQVREATGPEKEQIQKKLEQAVAIHFRHRQDRRKREIEDLARRLDQMRQQLSHREEKQAEILKSRVKELLDEDEGLKWDEARRGINQQPHSAEIAAGPGAERGPQDVAGSTPKGR